MVSFGALVMFAGFPSSIFTFSPTVNFNSSSNLYPSETMLGKFFRYVY